MELLELLTIVAQVDTNAFADAVEGLILPVVLIGLAAMSLVFAMQGRAAGLVGFLIVGVIIVMLITTPEVLQSMGEWLGGVLTGGSPETA